MRKALLTLLIGVSFLMADPSLALFPSVALGQIVNQTGFQESEKQWLVEGGLRGRYLFASAYVGSEFGIGIFDELVMSSAWVDAGLSRPLFENKLRLNFGGGLAYNGYAISRYPSSNGFTKEYHHYFSPFISCDYEYWKMLFRVVYQFESHYDARASVGIKIL